VSAVSPGTTAGTDTSALSDGVFGVEDLLSLTLQLLIPLLFLLQPLILMVWRNRSSSCC